MANERLTDQSAYTGKPSDGDVLHMVRTSDLTDNPAGSSKQVAVSDMLKGRSFKLILGCLVYSFVADPSKTSIVATDWVIWMDVASERLIIGVASATLATIPADLDNVAKFDKFIETSGILL